MKFYLRNALIAVVVVGSVAVHAAQTNWTGTGGSTAWSNSSNWSNGVPDNSKDVVLTGAGASRPTNQDIVGLVIPSLTFDATANTAISLTGSALTLTNLTIDPASADHVVSLPITLGGPSNWNIGAGRTVTVTGIGAVISGGFGITKSGGGTLVLLNSHTYTGSTTISDGKIQLATVLAPPTGMTMWLDAADPTKIVTSGGAVTQWSDSSGFNRHFTPYTIGGLPAGGLPTTYVTTGPGTINGKPVVHVQSPTGSNSFSALENATNFPAPCTIAYVGRITGQAQRLLAGKNLNWLLGYWGGAMDQAHYNSWINNPFGVPQTDSKTNHYLTTIPSSAPAIVYKNGTQILQSTGALPGPNGLVIGGGYNGTPNTEFSTGDVGELLYYPFVLSVGQRASLDAYIHYKWGLAPVASNILPTTTAVVLTSATAVLDCNGVSQTVGSLAGVAGSSIITGAGGITAGDATSTVFDGVISGNGGLAKTGAGNLTLGGANTFSGGTTINAGNLIATGVNVLSPNSTLTLAAGSNFNMNSFSQSLGSLAGSGNVALGSNAATVLTVGTNDASTTYLGVISGQGGFTKAGLGTFTISYVQTYTGATNITGGTFKLAGSITAVAPPAGSTVWLDATNAPNVILSAGEVTQWNDRNGGALNFTRNNAGGQIVTHVTSGPGMINGLPVIHTVSPTGDTAYSSLRNTTNFPTPCTVVFVGRVTGTGRRLVSATGSNWLLGYWGALQDQAHFGGGFMSNPSTAVTSATKMYMMTSTGSSCFFYANGTQLASTTNASLAQGPVGLTVGGGYAFNATTEYSTGDVGEMLVYNRVLSASERAICDSYLLSKWLGITTGSGVSVNMLPPTTTVTISNNGSLDLGIVTQTLASISGSLGTSLKMDAGLTVGGDNSTTSFLGGISGLGSLTKNGTGTFTMGGISTYSGNTTINGGTLRINNPGAALQPFASNMSLWLDANDTAHITQAAGKVTAWNDKNGTPVGVSQATTTLQPTLVTNSINGNNAVRFTAPNTLNNTINYNPTPTGFHIFGVGKMNGGANQRLISSRVNNWCIGWQAGRMDQFYFDNWASNGGNGPTTDTLPHMYEASIAGPGLNSNGYVYDARTGSVVQLFSNIAGTSGPDGLQLGSVQANTEASNGDVGEVIVYNRILNAAERAQTEAYLINRWFGGGLSANSSVTINAGILDINGTSQQVGSLAGAAGTQVLMGGGSLICGFNNASTNYGGSLSGGGTFGKAGTGTMSIGNTLGSLSALQVLGGTLNLPFPNATDANCAVTISNTGTLDCTNAVQAFGSLAGTGGGRLFMGNAATLTVGGNNTSTDFSGTISGQCNLIKNGTGTWGLGTAQTYTGATTVNTGTLKLLSGTDVIPQTSVMTLNNSSILDVNGLTQTLAAFSGGATTQILLGTGLLTLGGNNASTTYAGNISGANGRLVKAGTGTFTLTGTNTYSGGTTINGGVLKGNSNGVQNAIAMNNNTTVDFDQDIASGTFSGAISGTGNLIKNNTGTLILAGSASYTGTTLINAGILRLNPPVAPVPPPPPSGSLVWLDATSTSTVITSGGEVTQWNDRNGLAASNFTRNNAGGRIVTYVTSGPGMINGLPVIHTDSPTGITSFSSLQNTTNFGTPCTVVFVGRMSGTQNQRHLSGTGNNWLLGYWGGNQDQAHFGTNFLPGGSPATPATTATKMYMMTSTGSNAIFYGNGIQLASGTPAAGPVGLRIGGGYNGNPTTEYSTGDVGELLVYQRVLTTPERQQLETYLMTRWITGPSATATSLPATTNVTIAPTGTLDLNNNNVTIGSLTGASGSFVTLGSGTLTTGNATNTIWGGQISGSGGIGKAGTGRFTLTNPSIYSGSTSVSAGVLEVANGSGSATGTSAVTVFSAATLTGSGSIGGAVTVAASGIVSPGLTLGKLTTGNFSLAANSVLNVELLAPDGGAANTGGDDEMQINGNLTLNGTLNITSPGTLVLGAYHLATYTGTVSGNFTTINAPSGLTATVIAAGGSVDIFVNHRPTLVPILPQTVTEGQTIAFTATGADVDAGQTLTYSIQPPVPAGATIGSASGAFSWTTVDGPSQSQSVTIRVTDNGPGNLFAEQTFVATVNNVAPTATFANGGAVNEGSTGTVSFTGATDPSSADVTATFHYSYDFDNNGSFEVGGTTYALASTNASVTVPANFLADNPSRVVRGRIWDKDGGFTDFTTTITVNNVPPTAAFANNGPINEGSTATVTFTGATDVSPVDASSLRYSYDLDNDGNFDVGGSTYVAAVTQTFATVSIDDGPATRVVRGRVWDKDGGFTDYTTNVVVNSVSPTATLDAIGTLQEGSSGTVSLSGEFDPSSADNVAGFHYSFDFNNDGTFDSGGNSYGTALPNSSATIPASFVIDGTGPQTVRARIWDKDNSFSEYTQVFTIENVAPSLANLQAPAVDEGTAAVFSGTIIDPGILDTFNVHINWGDPGSPNNDEDYAVPASATGSQTFSYNHLYLNDPDGQPSFTVTITVTDKDGDFVQGTTQVFVNNASPVVTIPGGLAPQIPEHSSTGQILLATFTDAGFVDTHTVTVDWGDGSPLDLGAVLIEPSGGNPGEVRGNHLYDDGPRTRVVTVTVFDDEGADGGATFNIVVNNVAPTAVFQRPDAGSFSQMTSVEFVNSADVSNADTATGFVYSYDFNNDGSFEVLLSSEASQLIPAQYLSAQPNHIVRGRITDKDGGFTDYFLQQPFFASNPIFVDFDLGSPSSYTLVATAAPGATYTIQVVDLPAGVADMAALGLSFNGVATISGTPTIAGMLNLRATATNLGGSQVVDLIIRIHRGVNSNTPQIKSAPTANPNPAITGTPIEFSVVAIDADGDILSYFWDFKDGSTARGRVVTHTYTVPGTYFVECTVSDGKNDKGDHFNLVVARGEDNLFDIQQAKVSFDFRKAEKSTLYITGYIPAPSGPLLGVNATVSITGTNYSQLFQFDSKGAAGDTMSLFSLKTIQTGTGTNRAKFVFSLKSTNGLDPLNPSLFQKIGMIFPNTTDRAGATVPVPLVITIGSQPTQTAAIPMNYKVVTGRSGKGQYKRK